MWPYQLQRALQPSQQGLLHVLFFRCLVVCLWLQEWWNAATLADYWKLWNIPVHKWMLRTIFFPLVRRGAPRLASLLFVFFISAVMHERAVGVPLRMLRGWAFWGMMLQVGAVDKLYTAC
jgi:hypothetical protein